MKRWFVVAVMASMLAAFGVAAASASAVGICKTALGASTVGPNLEAGSGCVLNGTTVTGNVKVNSGGSLVASGATIGGDLQGTSATSITITESTAIRGNVQINGATSVTISGGSTIRGNVQINGASSVAIEAGVAIGGNLQIEGTTGNVYVASSSIKGNVQVQNGAACLAIERDTVGGHLQVQNLTPSVRCSGRVTIIGSSVHGGSQVQKAAAATSCQEFCSLEVGTENGAAYVTAREEPPGQPPGTLFASVNSSGPPNCPGQVTSDPNVYQFFTSPPNLTFSENVTLTYVAPAGVVPATQQVCFQAPYPFTTREGTPLQQGSVGGSPVYTGLLPDCTEGSTGPCVVSRGLFANEGTGRTEIEIEVFVPVPNEFGDPLMH